MSEDAIEEPKELTIRDHADAMLGALASNRTILEDQFSHASKWLLGALLTVNGGGALASINALVNFDGFVLPTALFVAGLVFALLNAVVIQHGCEFSLRNMSDRIAYWELVGRRGSRDEAIEGQIERIGTKIDRWGLIGPIFGWLSGVLFISAVAISAVAVTERRHEISSACGKLRAKMLSINSGSTQVPDVYKALGC